MKNNLVYYVSYGSNMLEERFLIYIKGGVCKFNGKNYDGCKNKNNPIDSKPIMIPYNMYFSKQSSSWNNSSICFLDYSKEGSAYGRAYLITKEQFKEIKKQEGKWYEKEINLGFINGYEAITFTNERNLEHMNINSIGKEYLNVIKLGLKESFNLSNLEINDYIDKCSKK